jgi:hypothetical protein
VVSRSPPSTFCCAIVLRVEREDSEAMAGRSVGEVASGSQFRNVA